MPLGASRAGLMSVAADDIPDSVVSRPDDNADSTTSTAHGLEIETKTEWASIGAEISNLTSGVTRAHLQDDTGNDIDTVDISGLTSGEAFTFDNVSLNSNNKYRIVLDANGSDFTLGRNTDADDYPYTSDDIDITARVVGNTVEGGAAVAVNNIGNTGFD